MPLQIILVSKLRVLAAVNPCVKVILNTRNFGHIRSPYYGLLQAYGDAVIMMASDLQDPPLLIKDFIQKWQEGFNVVLGIKTRSQETRIFYFFRSFYYKILAKLTDVQLIEHFTGFGLYDQRVIEIIRKIDDPYPYFRGLIADIGFPIAKIEFDATKAKKWDHQE